MKLKFLVYSLCTILVCAFCSCAPTNETDLTSSVENSSYYLLQDSKENKISVEVPLRNGISDSNLSLIESFVSEKLNNFCGENFLLEKSETKLESKDYTNYYIELELQATYVSDDLVSVVFSGLLNKKSAAHPTNLLFAFNFNPESNEQITLSSLREINADFYNEFSKQAEREIIENSGRWPEDWGSFSEVLCSEEYFIDGMKSEEEFSWYYEQNDIVIIYPVSHALGDYMSATLPR